MAATTKIEWCDSVFSPWIGCTRISPACDACYAAVSTPARAMRIKWGAGEARHRTAESTWRQPLVWERNHGQFEAEHGHRRRVFCAPLADVFDNEVPQFWRTALFGLIAQTPHLDWLLLTKRIGNAARMLADDVPEGVDITGRILLGATIANQEEADRDIPKLLATPARVRFLSCEPLLSNIDLQLEWLSPFKDTDASLNRTPRIDWTIAGGESGPKARPTDAEWFRSLQRQCAAAGVCFFMKQMGGARDKRGKLEDLPEDLRVREFPQ